MIYYIKSIILNPLEGEDTLEANLQDIYINTLGQYSPETLATLVLKSQTFRQFKSSKIFSHIKAELLKNENSKDALGVLAYVVLSVDQGSNDIEEATSYLKLIQPGRLSEVILEHHEFLVEEAGEAAQSLTDVAALMRDAVPVIFVEVLVSLIKSDVYSLQTVLHLLIGSLVSSSSSLADCRANDAALLQLFLESYFMDIIDASNPEDNAIILDGDQLQALHTLVRSYLTSLSVPVRFEEKNIDCNMFGSRYYNIK